jgi:transposase InsO family protein
MVYTKTKSTKVPIGERRKPVPDGKPGYIRVDSVHQGDDPTSGKGVYHLNFIDEVTQWELVACVETISEFHLKPVFEDLLIAFPFTVASFHSDNGSEFINKVVAEILERLRIKQTKSRPRHTNDNALNEGKNGSVIRKQMGYHHIPRNHAPSIHAWYQTWFNPYLNFHRPCAYPLRKVDGKGKEVITYPKENYATPYAKFRSLLEAQS